LTLANELVRLRGPFENANAAEIGGGGVELDGLERDVSTPTPEDQVALLRGGWSSGDEPLRPGEADVAGVESEIPAAKGLPFSSEPPEPPDALLDVVGREPLATPGGVGRLRPMTGPTRGSLIPPLPVSSD